MLHPLRTLSMTAVIHSCRAAFLCFVAGLGCALASGGIAGAADTDGGAESRVAAHLAAGEFGLALEASAKVTDTAKKTALIQSVARAQKEAGEPVTATALLPRTSRSARTPNGARLETNLGGGGSQANFQQLMQMIQQNTSGKWDSVDGEGGSMTPDRMLGVRVAPNGFMSKLVATDDKNGGLATLATEARKADLNADVARRSELRLVSLTRLERAVAQRLAEGLPVPETMAQMAGLSQVKYVFVYPETNEIVIGGPAEGWNYNAKGEPIGETSHRPTLQLDDMVTVLRTFAGRSKDFGCSINTRDSGVKAMMEYAQASQARGPLNSNSVRNWVNQLQKKLGKQDIQIWGVPVDSRVAGVIVEADYRMKLIGIDKVDAGKEIPSYFDLLAVTHPKNPPAMDALRWWLTMKYDAVLHSADKSVFEIQGSSVLCQSENQFLTAEGKHVGTDTSEQTNRMFADNFTTHYSKLAERDSVFADMQNIFDLALVAALIQHEQLHAKIGWDLGVFMPQGVYTPVSFAVPKEIDSVVNHRVYNGKDIVVQVAGGVRGDLRSVVSDSKKNVESPRLEVVGQAAKAADLPAGRWWWDVAR